MKRKGLQGTAKVFRFSFARLAGKKGWLLGTILPALLLLIAIPAALLIADRAKSKPETVSPVRTVFVADETGLPADYAALRETGESGFADIEYVSCADFDEALECASETENALALQVCMDETGYQLRLVRPEDSALRGGDAGDLKAYLRTRFPVIALQKSGIDARTLAELGAQIASGASTSEAYRTRSEQSGFELMREIVDAVLPYLGIMLLYFMVLIYGQGIAGAVVLEKSNKLMDTMLLSLRPEAMVLGKLLAGALTGILQMAAWIAGIVGGCVLGNALVLAQDPESELAVIRFFGLLGKASGLFTAGNVVLSVLILLSGFLMYCGIAAIGGALAPRAEDLGSCNSVFTMLLVASFLLTIFGETGSSTAMVSDAAWMNYVPFTAVLCTPARVLLGKVPLGTSLVSLALIWLLTLAAVLIAGRLYQLLTFHKGKAPKITDIPKLLRAD